ncbi:MAG TPA: hypothetical protein VNJ54_07865 [Plantibacter sp.]|uniref:hypothetical protein n=1 Tax=unclassified Plantibacter TaxID=2624265 RepID=UPI002C36F280|nr:hypothetical protein [Plantibacter sp.]
MTFWKYALGSILLIGSTVGVTLGVVEANREPAAVVETVTPDMLEAEFDRGMKAGVEYQEWFCTNEVVPFVPAVS